MFDTVSFRDIRIDDAEIYDRLAEYGGGWRGEAYYTLCACKYLPETVDRILYLDAGDTFVAGDIDDYYSDSFNGKSLTVQAARFKAANDKLVTFDADDLSDRELLPGILRGLFNSGSYMMNIRKMRHDRMSEADFLYLAETLKEALGIKGGSVYFGDQGLLSAAYVGDIHYWRYPRIVIHFAGTSKPWFMDYPVVVYSCMPEGKLMSISELKIGQAEWYYLWHLYSIELDMLMKEDR